MSYYRVISILWEGVERMHSTRAQQSLTYICCGEERGGICCKNCVVAVWATGVVPEKKGSILT